MTTAIPMVGSLMNKQKMMTELVCPCGNRLEVSINKNGWFLSLQAVALANRWLLSDSDHGDLRAGCTFPARCPNCHDQPEVQRRD